VLAVLADSGPMNQAAIANRLSLAPRSITDAIDAMERDGQAERRSDPRDRRAWIVGLTDQGQVANQTALAAKAKAWNQIFGNLDAVQRAELAGLLGCIRSAVNPDVGESND
jgi:DNA-binding MarR family transcriptional regulator